MLRKTIDRYTARERDEALDKLDRAMAAHSEAAANRSHVWDGKPCPVCGEVWNGDHRCKEGRYPEDAIPFHG